MIEAKIIHIDVKDIRFPTSLCNPGSDTMHTKFGHSCIYVIIETNKIKKINKSYQGYGISYTLGIGNELVVQMCKMLSELVKNRTTTEIFNNFAIFWRMLTRNIQFTWMGSDCGVVRLATAAIVNALWDLWARIEDKPVWKLLTDMTPEQLVSTVDFTYITDLIDKETAMNMLEQRQPNKKECEKELKEEGYPAYAADITRKDYKKKEIQSHCAKYTKLGFNTFEFTLTSSLNKRNECFKLRRIVGWNNKILLHMNQFSEEDFKYYIEIFKILEPFAVEEPTAPDDVLMYVPMRNDLRDDNVQISCGEICANRVVFKQYKKHAAANFWHVNVARLGGINEVLAVYFMAMTAREEKDITPIWARTDGIGLAEMAQHLQMWDYICLSQTTENRSIQFADRQHGYFENPIFVKNARYMPPTLPGLSTKLKDKCIARWSYPEGTRWKKLLKENKSFTENE